MHELSRRGFLGSAFGGVVSTVGLGLPSWSNAEGRSLDQGAALGRPDTLFLSWQRDPTTTMTVQWIAAEEAIAPAISYSRHGYNDWHVVATRARPFPTTNRSVFRAELTGLSSGTEYEFRIGVERTSHRFRTMPARATNAFHFISGGDCGVNQHAINNNIVAARQDPMFALIGGDLGYDDGQNATIAESFIRNYSRNMTDSQGRLIPMVVCIGNHEVRGGYNGRREHAPFSSRSLTACTPRPPIALSISATI